ncbi:MAG: TPM domain-containing protein, partial [Acidobacteriota bacterium]
MSTDARNLRFGRSPLARGAGDARSRSPADAASACRTPRRHGQGVAGLVAAVVLVLCAAVALALDVPRLTGRVNDTARLLSPAAVARLDATLAAFERSDSTQVVVLTIPSLEGEPLEDYAIKVAQAWGIGQKGKDNGVLLLVSKNDRKVRVEVGY